MRPVRIECVIPAYWPASGNAQRLAGELALAAGARGPEVSLRIVTARGFPEWADQFLLDGATVVRVGPGSEVLWRKREFQRGAMREVRSLADGRTVVLLLDCAAQAAVWRDSLPEGTRLVVRFDQELPASRLAGPVTIRRLARSLAAADAVWVAREDQAGRLMEAGLEAGRIELVPDAVFAGRAETETAGPGPDSRREMAFAGLAAIRQSSYFGAGRPMVFCVWPDVTPAQWQWVLSGWRGFVRHAQRSGPWQPCLWIAGNGPGIGPLMEQCHRLDLEDSVFFSGSFDSLDDCFLAADLVVHPAEPGHQAVGLLQAMRSGARCLALEGPVRRQDWLQDNVNIHFLSGPVGDLFAARLEEILLTTRENGWTGLAAAEAVRQHRDIGGMLDRLVGLVRSGSVAEQGEAE